MKNTRTIQINDLISSGVVQDILSAKATFLCGSAVSIAAPTSLQPGLTVTWELATALCLEAGLDVENHDRDIFDQVNSTAFEALMQAHPDEYQVEDIIARYFCRSPGKIYLEPNGAHEALASLFAKGYANHIITPNYDEGIELALKQFDSKFVYDRCVGLPSVQPKRPLLLKIHGTATDKKSLVFTLDREAIIPSNHRPIIQSIFGDRLVIIGYSGRDFEICPEIYAATLDHIYWIARPKASNPNEPDLEPLAERILAQHSSTIICGDLYKFLEMISGKPFITVPTRRPESLTQLLMEGLSKSDRLLWAARVFSSCSIPSACRKAVERRGLGADEVERLYLYTGGSHAGRYFDQAKNCLADARAANEPTAQIEHLLGACGAYGMGDFVEEAKASLDEAIAVVWRNRRSVPRELLARVRWLHILHREDEYEEFDGQQKGKSKRARKLLYLHAEAQGSGQYGHAATLADWLWSKEDIKLSESFRGEMIREAEELYNQVGNFVGQVSKVRLRAYREADQGLAMIMIGYIPRLIKFELWPELFRVYHVAIHFENNLDRRHDLFKKFNDALSRCQVGEAYRKREIAQARAAVDSPERISLP